MINIAEILKDCPKGTKLYSPICGECRLIKIYDGLGFDVINDTDDVFNFSYDGRYNLNGECCIFPSKDNRDWNTFHRPFQDGDVISNNGYIAIFHKFGKPKSCEYDKVIYYHCWCYQTGKEFKFKKDFGIGRDTDFRFATEDEKRKLFNIIKENGYKWNAETKTLEKLIEPKFKSGDKIVKKDNPTECWYVQGIDIYDNSFYFIVANGKLANLPLNDQDEWELLVAAPKFKAGDKIKEKNERFPSTRTINNYVEGIGYFTTINDWVRIEDQDNWELVSNKFDISNLKAYDKVLVRDTNVQVWVADLFSHVLDRPLGGYTFACVGHYSYQCIPYEGNEHLLGTNNDCDEFYKNW